MIYLDHAAATPVCKEALDAMLPYFTEDFFNPSAPYLPAKQVKKAYEEAKGTIAHAIGAKGADLVMTSGATESINLAFSVIDYLKNQSAHQNHQNPNALILATEHAAVLAAASKYPHQKIKVNKKGLIDLDDLRSKITDETVLVSVSLVNNELGTIQPITEIAELIKTVRQERLKNPASLPLYLHSDASQALNLIDFNVARLGVDLLTISAAKVYGPKAVGALYIDHQVRLQPTNLGGGQERGLRSGTENVAGVISFAAAAARAKARLKANQKKYTQLKQLFKTEILAAAKNQKLPEPIFLGSEKKQLLSFCPISFPGIDAERLIYQLEAQEIYLSTGAACAANKGKKSHVLEAIGLSDAEIAGSLRISLGEQNTPDDIKTAAHTITEAVKTELTRQKNG